MRARRLLLLAPAALLAVPAWADDDDDEELPFDVAEVFFELNNTDGDLGIHALIDGEPWKRLSIENDDDRKLLNVFVRSQLRRQGLTEIFFESAEPPFDELAPETFFRRFPEGEYEVEGVTLEGTELESEVLITHRMPAPPQPSVNGVPMAMQCDDEEPGYDAPELSSPITISFPAVTTSHPDLGSPRAAPGLVVYNYQVVVEADLEGPDGEEFTTVFSTILPPGDSPMVSLTIPDEFIGQTDEWKYEVLVREESFNQTAVESCFLIADE